MQTANNPDMKRIDELGLLAGMGADVVRDMARSGRLGPAALGAAARCGWEPLQAWMAGDRASEPVAASKAERCSRCQYQTTERMGIAWARGERHYCGLRCDLRAAAAAKAGSPPDPGCGCLVAVTVRCERHPAGKALLKSFVCPIGFFDAAGRNPRP